MSAPTVTNVGALLREARGVAASCASAEASRVIHLLCEALETCDRERAGLEALKLLSLETVADRKSGLAIRMREDPTGIARLLASSFMDILDDPSLAGATGPRASEPAPNYVEMTMRGPRGGVVVTVRRTGGRTPRDLQVAAERQRDEALAERDAATAERDAARAALLDSRESVARRAEAWSGRLSRCAHYLTLQREAIGAAPGETVADVADGLARLREELASVGAAP